MRIPPVTWSIALCVAAAFARAQQPNQQPKTPPPAAVLTWMAPVVVERARDDGTTERFAATQELVLQEGWNVLALCRSADLQRWREGERAVET